MPAAAAMVTAFTMPSAPVRRPTFLKAAAGEEFTVGVLGDLQWVVVDYMAV